MKAQKTNLVFEKTALVELNDKQLKIIEGGNDTLVPNTREILCTIPATYTLPPAVSIRK